MKIEACVNFCPPGNLSRYYAVCLCAPFCKWISFPHFAVTFLHAIWPRRMHEKHRHCKVSMKHEDEKGKTRHRRGNNKKERRSFAIHSVFAIIVIIRLND